MKNANMENLAMDLLDFCGGSLPTFEDLYNWMRMRDYKFKSRNRVLILQTAEQLLTMP